MSLKWMIPALFLVAAPVVAQTDSSADAGPGFVAQVEAAKGVILRVPINARGEENTNEADLRLHMSDTQVNSLADAEEAFDEGTSAAAQPTVTESDIQDGSTYGWWGYRGYGWRNPYYYSSYRPYYFYYGSYYNYYRPYYYNSNYYRYYYYPYSYYY